MESITRRIKNRRSKNRRTIKKRERLQQSELDIQIDKNKIKDFMKEVRSLNKKINSKNTNRPLKEQLKNKQGVLIRKVKKLKAGLELKLKKNKFIKASGPIQPDTETGSNKSCDAIGGENFRVPYNRSNSYELCYLQTARSSDCSKEEQYIKTDKQNQNVKTYDSFSKLKGKFPNKVVYCPVGSILDRYGDDFEFIDLIRTTRDADSKNPNTIDVHFRFSTPQTGKNYKFTYTSRNGHIPKKPVVSTNSPVSWTRQTNYGATYGPGAWRKLNKSTSTNVQIIYPEIVYERKMGGPYSRFKDRDAKKWPRMPLWIETDKRIKKLAKEIFSGAFLKIPSVMEPKNYKKDKIFEVSDYKLAPIKWTGELEKYHSVKDYFKKIPYKFVFVVKDNKLIVVVDIQLKGKLMSVEKALRKLKEKKTYESQIKLQEDKLNDEIKKQKQALRLANERRESSYVRQNLAKLIKEAEDKKRRLLQKKSIGSDLKSINKTLVNNCDHHLDRIREIVRDMTGYDSDDDGNYNAYEKARNNDLKIKYLREH